MSNHNCSLSIRRSSSNSLPLISLCGSFRHLFLSVPSLLFLLVSVGILIQIFIYRKCFGVVLYQLFCSHINNYHVSYSYYLLYHLSFYLFVIFLLIFSRNPYQWPTTSFLTSSLYRIRCLIASSNFSNF